ncbi:helix-turn-helix domain-containing protein [Eremococcus coleocola]|uniref:helix-turn-helix domain-containing protein n=1 Tax=Eremococcus coleocola TaxID=88132 RepID=UPI00048318A9|nr:helix-turn-helix transcriptional regulator [Eremococcus coleocola]
MTISYNKLWKILIDKDLSKTDLRKLSGISTNSLAKLGKNEIVSFEVLMKIACVLNCKVEDLFETYK